MKKIILLVAIICGMNALYAQTWDEWFKQKETAKEYQLKQVAALKLYTGYLAKGIEVAYKGLHLINDIKSGDLNLHHAFFKSFSLVNPKIKRYSSTNDIVYKQQQILVLYRKTKEVLNGGSFTTNEKTYFRKVFNELIDDCTKDIEQLILITSNDNAEMKDDARLRRIKNLHVEMEDKYLFTRHFTNEIEQLHINRVHERNSILSSRNTYGVK